MFIDSLPCVESRTGVSQQELQEDIIPAGKPVILKGLVSDWPVVQAGKQGAQAARDYVLSFYQGLPIHAFFGEPGMQGRYFYNDSIDGFNYKEQKSTLDALFLQLAEYEQDSNSGYCYLGSTYTSKCLPGFEQANPLSLLPPSVEQKIWIGNQSRIAAHYDIPLNIACCAVGRRRFTLLPAEQVENLYVGPLDFTPAGQSLSLVDFYQPDLKRFPKFERAMEAATVAELEPGDGLYLPSMWWHHVESFDDFNVLINYWWNEASRYSAHPFDSLLHTALAIRDLPADQKQAWEAVFRHYVFSTEYDPMQHLTDKQSGLLGELTPELARKLRMMLMNGLNR